MALEYQHDIPADSDEETIEKTKAHVREHLSAIADADDDPQTNADDVHVWVAKHPQDPGQLRVEGRLDAERQAFYDDPDFNPYEGIDPALLDAGMPDRTVDTDG